MSRIPRIEGKNLIYYISTEGKNREHIFKDDFDKEFLINLWKQHKLKSRLQYYTYIILPHKYALIMETSKSNLASVMHNINSRYANYFNKHHNRKNTLFKERYTCFIVDKNNYLVDVSLYVHLLPKKERIAKSIYNYKWSSLPGYLNKKRRKNWIDYDTIFSLLHSNSPEKLSNYSKLIKENLNQPIVSPFNKLKREIILGDGAFKKGINKKRYTASKKKEEMFLVNKIIELCEQSFSNYPKKLKRVETKTLSRNSTIYFLKKYTDLTNQRISTFFSSLNKSSVSQMNRRFSLLIEQHNTIKIVSNRIEKIINSIIL